MMGERKINTSYVYPPIPDRRFDWCATFDDYDGAPDAGFQPVGYGHTEQDAIHDLLAEDCKFCGDPRSPSVCDNCADAENQRTAALTN